MGGATLQDICHTLDAGGNLSSRVDVTASFSETFTYDFLDRLTAVSGNYTQSYAYEGTSGKLGNITSMNGRSYTYGQYCAGPHAVTSITNPTTTYTYDENGNMLTRGTDNITWDVENRPVKITAADGTVTTFVYDGDGNRVEKSINDGETLTTILYANKFYEVNLTTSTETSYYCPGCMGFRRPAVHLS